MWNKIIYGIFTILFLSACGSDKKDSDITALTSDDQTIGTNRIVGEWTVNSKITRDSDTEMESKCNICPVINFNRNNTAVLAFANGRTEKYSWKITFDTLTLLGAFSPTHSTVPYFMNFKYKTEYKQEKDFLELKLSPDIDLIYVLRR